MASTQIGFTRRLTRSGTAARRIACLSLMEIELSIMNNRSILSTEVCVILSTKMLVVTGGGEPIGRSRQAMAARATPAPTQNVATHTRALGRVSKDAQRRKPRSELICIQSYPLLE